MSSRGISKFENLFYLLIHCEGRQQYLLAIWRVKSLHYEKSPVLVFPSISSFLSSRHFDHSLKVEAADITSDLTKAVLYSKVP
jgi:hypothetical protein